MLIEFQVSNFRSFRDRQTFSMVAGSYPEHHETNSFDPRLPGFGRLVRSGAVYGANAAGKSNLLFALQFLQQLVLTSAASEPSIPPPYHPFKLRKASRSEPSEFQVSFVQNEIRYEYGVSLNGEQIRDEWLMEYVNPRGRTLFERAYDERRGKYNWKFSSFLKGRRTYWSEATPPNTLFLSRAVQLNSEQLLPVYEWFQKRLVIIAGISTLNPVLTTQLLNDQEGKSRLLPFLREADLGITGIDVKREPVPSGPRVIVGSPYIEQAPGSAAPNLLKITLSHATGSKEKVGLDISEESAGTQALFRSAGAWLNVLANGEVLLLDEIDTSLHPLLARFLIARFHSRVANARNAQLIFTTHNTYFLDQELFRRDQIWFVEKGADGASKVYPLTDFRPRNDEVLDRWYLRGRYGALPVLGESQ